MIILGKYKTTIGVNSLAFLKLNKLKKKLKKKYSIDSLPNTKLLSLLMAELEASEKKIKNLESSIKKSNDEIKSGLDQINSKLSNFYLSKPSVNLSTLTPPPKSITNIKIDYTKIEYSDNIIKDFGKELNTVLGHGQLKPSSVCKITEIKTNDKLESLEEYKKRLAEHLELVKKREFKRDTSVLEHSVVLAKRERFTKERKL